MLKLNIVRITYSPDHNDSGRVQNLLSMELPDDPVMIAEIMSTVADVLVKRITKEQGGPMSTPKLPQS